MRMNEQIEQSTAVHQESDDPEYLAWKDAKVSAALTAARAHPERRVAQAEVWKKFGLEA